MTYTSKQKGFSLVEISMVLIIIGLLLAGAIGGAKLIHRAQLYKTITQIKNLDEAITTFYLAYEALPGDFANASNYFNTDSVTVTDGDGNMRVETSNSESVAEAISSWYEHLSAANMISGHQYDSSNRPLITFPSAWSVQFVYTDQLGAYKAKNILQAYDHQGTGNVEAAAADMRSIDVKVDNDEPYTGLFHSTTEAACDGATQDCCTTKASFASTGFSLADNVDAKYAVSAQEDKCGYFFMDINLGDLK